MRLLSLDDVSVIAHRGGSSLRPENTMAAFDHAAALGVDAIECDVHLSRDGEPVVIHDATLDRTTDASGPVGERTAAELVRLDAGFRFGADGQTPFRGAGYGVPTLAEVLDRHPALAVVVELKGRRPDLAERVLQVVRDAGAAGRVVVGGYDQGVLEHIRRRAPEVVTSASEDELRSAVRRSRLWMGPGRHDYRLVQAPYRLEGRPVFGRTFVRAVRRADLPVQAWIVDAEGDIRRLLDWGVTGIISDCPDVALRVAGRRAGGADRDEPSA
jgi:glycerophosphoryl diester phosphodiesterase